MCLCVFVKIQWGRSIHQIKKPSAVNQGKPVAIQTIHRLIEERCQYHPLRKRPTYDCHFKRPTYVLSFSVMCVVLQFLLFPGWSSLGRARLNERPGANRHVSDRSGEYGCGRQTSRQFATATLGILLRIV